MDLTKKYSMSIEEFETAVSERLEEWMETGFADRLWGKDHTLWSPEPLPELTDRLGWLTLPEEMKDQIGMLESFSREIREEGIGHVALLGMGGSSLAPEVFQKVFGSTGDHPELTMLDSTHPDAVRAVEGAIDPGKTLFLVSSKSGGTLETLSFFRYFWERVSGITEEPGRHFAAITDPGSSLASLASERGFRRIFETPPDVGGRYSALTFFGLVPAALIGLDLHEFLERAAQMAKKTSFAAPGPANPALMLGAVLGELTLVGRDKVTFVVSPSLEAFPSWLEQLIAESTGKDDRGVLPVADEPLGLPESYGKDRFIVHMELKEDKEGAADREVFINRLEEIGHPVVRIVLDSREDLAREMFAWEVAVAAAGSIIDIHPFNQPDVQLAKDLARRAMAGELDEGGGPLEEFGVSESGALEQAAYDWARQASAGDYFSIHAYLAPSEELTGRLRRIQSHLRDRRKLATTLGYGPRFLHSTGQLHKGGPNSGLFLQLVDEPGTNLPVPETDYTFGALVRAQSIGDYQALRQRKRRVLRVNLGRDVGAGMDTLEKAMGLDG